MKYIIVDNYLTEYGQLFDTAEEAQAECDYLNIEDGILEYEVMPA